MKLKKVGLLFGSILCVTALASCDKISDNFLSLDYDYVDEEEKTYTVTFNTNGGSSISELNVKEKTTAVEPKNPTKDGYTFGGWYKDSALEYKFDFNNTIINNNITLYAKWTADVTTYTVTFNTNGGSSVSDITVEENGYATEPSNPTKSGYTFAGWYTTSNLTTEFNFSTTKITKDTTLYAKFVEGKVVEYIVDGKTVNLVAVDEGEKIEKPTNPVKDGYKFLGWETSDGSYWDFNKPVTNDLTLTARFKEFYITVDDNEYDTFAGTVDIHLNYNGVQGVSYRGTAGTSWANAVDGVTYTNGKILPSWQAFAIKTKTTIREACCYSTTKDDANYAAFVQNNYMSDTDKSQYVDLFYNRTANIIRMGNSGKAVDLTSYIEAGKMPNFKKFLDANQAVKEEITSNGKIFFTPYFESYNDVERCLIMDTQIVKTLLDDASANYDIDKTNGKNGDYNVITDVKYQPFINADYNYAADTKVKVSVNGVAKEITIKRTENIIKQQNALLEHGCTGKDLALQFKAYLKQAFGAYVGSGKIYESYSQIFTEEQASYNVDELIALMRVAKANPGLITGDPSKEVETLFPRGQAANRIQNILQFAQVWGVQGLTSEKDFLYYLQDGTLNDARTTQASYDALDNLAALYSEGLILGDFWYCSDSAKNGNAYLNRYFKKSTSDYSFGLMEYDYVATQCVGNDIYDGIGTASSTRTAYTGEVKGIKPIIAPLTYWGTEKSVTHNQALNDRTGKTLMRHYDENRTIKYNAWCIPATADNKEGAVRIMDYMFSTMGSYIQDFGPEGYWENAAEVKANLGTVSPVISRTQKDMFAATNLDFLIYMRGCMGSTHGIGHVRSHELQVQATNYYGQKGYNAIHNAISSGVLDLSMVNKDGDNNSGTVTWNTSVPVNNYTGAPAARSEAANSYDATLSFWAQDKNKDVPYGWVYVVANGGWTAIGNTTELGATVNSGVMYSKADVVTQQENMNKLYLYAYADSLNNNFNVTTFIPEYAKQN